MLTAASHLDKKVRDRPGDPGIKALSLTQVWEVDVPRRRAMYEAERESVQDDVRRIANAKFGGQTPEVKTELSPLAAQLPLGLDAGCNETLLLHGTRADLVLTIAMTGLSERLAGQGRSSMPV